MRERVELEEAKFRSIRYFIFIQSEYYGNKRRGINVVHFFGPVLPFIIHGRMDPDRNAYICHAHSRIHRMGVSRRPSSPLSSGMGTSIVISIIEVFFLGEYFASTQV